MAYVSKQIIDKVIQTSDIVDVVSEFVTLKKAGKNYMGVCPFHSDKGPSLSVSAEKQLYHCFGCGASGNVVSFIMNIRRLEFIDSIKYLADKYSIIIEEKTYDPEKRKQDDLKQALYNLNIDIARYFFNNLKGNQKPLDYLKDREIDSKLINKFGLGFSYDSWDSVYKYLKSKGYSEELIKISGLVSVKETKVYDRFRNRIMFPVFDVKGRVIGFGARVMDDSKPKYLNSPETPVFYKGTNLYGLNFVVKNGLPEFIIVVEGYMDCISLHKHGIACAVASLGTALTTEQAKLIKRYTKDVYICYDADSAGMTAALRGLSVLTQVGCLVKIISIPEGKDPDDFLKKNGAKAFNNLIKNALPIVEFRIEMERKGKNLKDIEQKNLFSKAVVEILSELTSEMEIQLYASRVYDETGIDVTAILEEIQKIKRNKIQNENNISNNRDNNKASGNNYNIEPAYVKSEKELLKYMIKDEKYFNYIEKKVSKDEFVTPIYQKTYALIIDKITNSEEVSAKSLLEGIEDKSDINNISQLFYFDDLKIKNDIDAYKLIDDFIKNIKKVSIEKKMTDLIVKIKKHEADNEVVESAALSQELIKLQKLLSLL